MPIPPRPEKPAAADTGIDAAGAFAALEPVRSLRRRWPTVLGALVTLAMVGGLANELLDKGLAGLSRSMPQTPFYYLFFLVSYFALPVTDFIIYRRLWRVPFSAFAALNRKRIANEMLLGYSGDAYFYAWARERMTMVTAPFGTVKDVSIVSGIAANVTTILLAAVALPLGFELIDPAVKRAMLWSLTIPFVVSVLIIAFSRRVFALPRGDLLWVFAAQTARILIAGVALALAWSSAMPDVGVGMWMFLIAGRELVLRLPFVPNKDLLFANFAILLIGQDRTLSDLIAFTAAASLAMHLLLTAMFGAIYVAERMSEWGRRR